MYMYVYIMLTNCINSGLRYVINIKIIPRYEAKLHAVEAKR